MFSSVTLHTLRQSFHGSKRTATCEKKGIESSQSVSYCGQIEHKLQDMHFKSISMTGLQLLSFTSLAGCKTLIK
jgi:hypothetical protein